MTAVAGVHREMGQYGSYKEQKNGRVKKREFFHSSFCL